jgi:hypothetical protein
MKILNMSAILLLLNLDTIINEILDHSLLHPLLLALHKQRLGNLPIIHQNDIKHFEPLLTLLLLNLLKHTINDLLELISLVREELDHDGEAGGQLGLTGEVVVEQLDVDLADGLDVVAGF